MSVHFYQYQLHNISGVHKFDTTVKNYTATNNLSYCVPLFVAKEL